MDQAAFFVYNNFIQINYYEAVFLDNKQYLLIIAAVIAAFIFRNLFTSEAKSPGQNDIKSNTAPSRQSDEELGILHVVEVAPRFPGCEDLSTIDEKKNVRIRKCSNICMVISPILNTPKTMVLKEDV